MTVTITHPFVSPKADGVDTTLVRPSNWNDDHEIELSGPGVVGRTAAGPGAASLVALSTFAVPTGAYVAFAGATVPDGWLLCYGQAVSRATYATLFAVTGVVYGTGDGATTFNLPDLRGRVVAGKDNMGGVNAARLSTVMSSTTLGAVGGVQSATTTITGSTAGSLTVTTTAVSMDGPNTVTSSNPGVGQNHAGPTHTHANLVSTGATSGSLTVSGTSASFNIVQPTMIANYIIKT